MCVSVCNFALCGSVSFQSTSSCLEDLDESRSLQLKELLAEYFDKRRDRGLTLAPVDIEEPDKYKVGPSGRQEFTAAFLSLMFWVL